MSPSKRRRARVRLAWTGVVAAAVVASALAIPSYGGTRDGSLRNQNEARKAALGAPQTDPPGTAAHDHDDSTINNAISRAGEVGAETRDPTTAAEARANAAYVASERRNPDPRLTTVPVTQKRKKLPQNRYAMAGGCYRLGGEPIYFKATDLGSYLLYDRKRRFVVAGGGREAEPSRTAEWTVRKAGNRFSFDNRGPSTGPAGTFKSGLKRTKGCASYPESQIDVAGKPHAGVTPFQEVRGYVDAHTHGMAFEFLGGQVHCGRPWHRYGAPYALVDCPDHSATGGNGAVLETVLSGEPSHDPVGWPTFKDWPAPNSLTHEGTYYRWMERAWRGGERLFVNLLVENNKLCELYPLKRNSCDDMDSIRLQARQMYNFQDYIDAQFGGPGKGFYRIVKTPFEARKVINAGKMAVIMGIETSVPFGCTFKAVLGNDVPACTAADITRQINEMHRLGVRQMELVNKFDNALSGVAGDEGSTGVAVNSANFLETGTFWDMRSCEPADGESSDRAQLAFPDIGAGQQDALFGAVAQIFGGVLPALPLYGPPAHCNSRGLTSLGEHTINELVKRKMVFDPDHMSVKGRRAAMDHLQKLRYPGILSSHSWSTPDTYPRIYKAGGFITPYAGDSTGFVEKWRRHVGWADERYYYGIGFGADINGLGAQGSPRGANVRNKVNYPFRGINGITVKKQRAGKRVYDINKDGVAQYGLYPDWIEDLRKVAGRQGDALMDDMSRGPEAYLQMWERAQGIKPDSCRNPGLRKSVSKVRQLVRPGMGTQTVMRKVGQPFTRLGATYGICAKAPGQRKVTMAVIFDRGGTVTAVRRLP